MIKHILGIGNALTDMLVNLKSDDVLNQYGIARGSMSLVDSQLQSEVSKLMRFYDIIAKKRHGYPLLCKKTLSAKLLQLRDRQANNVN